MPAIETELVGGGGHILAMQVPQVVNRRVLAFLGKPPLPRLR